MLKKIFPSRKAAPAVSSEPATQSASGAQRTIGLIAGNSTFPILFAQAARDAGYDVVAVCHAGETESALEPLVHHAEWIKVGELGKIINTFKKHGVKEAVMAGGINRVKLFGGVKLDLRGAALLARLRSTKDDVIMRGIASELHGEGIEVVPSTLFMHRHLVELGVLTRAKPTEAELEDIRVGREALRAMSAQDIGQLVVVREGVVVAVEAVEGSDAAILRGGDLGGPGTVIVKYAKSTQDMRFDVPIAGLKTIDSMLKSKARVLALEAGRCLLLDREEVVRRADEQRLVIIGCEPLGQPLVGQSDEPQAAGRISSS